ncbi:hypothetical protein PsorP6_018255 [Peronosclerospora sorghi]|uniref:Uncharacterized protein n=1 Tax=Peronosclerospora sorghi TaxID=230839 RepID=A0ACC0WCC3_9STRA|nr:hypothetical protein PsorP6_018255 [Peronosclerospora sorghi]
MRSTVLGTYQDASGENVKWKPDRIDKLSLKGHPFRYLQRAQRRRVNEQEVAEVLRPEAGILELVRIRLANLGSPFWHVWLLRLHWSCVDAYVCAARLRIFDVETEILRFTSGSVQTLEFRHISSYADNGSLSMAFSDAKRILHKISGSVSRDEVLGLKGPSGSGKMTLLNALAAEGNGQTQFTGDLLLDGRRLSNGYRRIAAYVQQDDSLYSTLTVRESFIYSAQLRLPAPLSDETKMTMVARVIAELHLSHVAHLRVGKVEEAMDGVVYLVCQRSRIQETRATAGELVCLPLWSIQIITLEIAQHTRECIRATRSAEASTCVLLVESVM